MIKPVRPQENIYFFMKEHPDLKLKLSTSGNVTDVIFPKNCTSSLLIIVSGKIKFLQYVTSESDNLSDNTYLGEDEDSYFENMRKYIREQKL